MKISLALLCVAMMVGCGKEVVIQTVPVTVTVPVYKDREPILPTKPSQDDLRRDAENRIAEKKKQEAAVHEERLRQGRIAFNKETEPVQQACKYALADIKAGKVLHPEQIQMLFRFYQFHEQLIGYLIKAAEKNGFDTLVKLTGAKDKDRIADSMLAFGSYDPQEQALMIKTAQNIKKGNHDNDPDVIKMLERLSIMKEILDNHYDR